MQACVDIKNYKNLFLYEFIHYYYLFAELTKFNLNANNTEQIRTLRNAYTNKKTGRYIHTHTRTMPPNKK